MTKAQTELLIQLAITLRALAPPDDYRAIQDCLRALAREETERHYSAWAKYRPEDAT